MARGSGKLGSDGAGRAPQVLRDCFASVGLAALYWDAVRFLHSMHSMSSRPSSTACGEKRNHACSWAAPPRGPSRQCPVYEMRPSTGSISRRSWPAHTRIWVSWKLRSRCAGRLARWVGVDGGTFCMRWMTKKKRIPRRTMISQRGRLTVRPKKKRGRKEGGQRGRRGVSPEGEEGKFNESNHRTGRRNRCCLRDGEHHLFRRWPYRARASTVAAPSSPLVSVAARPPHPSIFF